MSPYEEGYAAARAGKADWSNPYPIQSPSHQQWLAGWKRFGRNITTVR